MALELYTARITNKYTSKGLQPLNGKYMHMDFPFKRPILYNFQFDYGDSIQVDLNTFNSYEVGSVYQYWKDRELEAIGAILALVFVIVIIGFLVYMQLTH